MDMVVDDDGWGDGGENMNKSLVTSHFDFAFSESDSLEGLGARLLRLVEKESKEKNARANAGNQATKQLPR